MQDILLSGRWGAGPTWGGQLTPYTRDEGVGGALPLGEEDPGAEERARLLDLQEGQEVHALVLRLGEQGVDPA